MLRSILSITQIVFAILLMLLILLQNKGAGLSEVFGGSSAFYTSRRGVEKYLFIGTVIIAVLFFLNSLAFIFV